MNAYEAYSKKAATIATRHQAPLVGKIKTRREAMIVYQEIVNEIHACGDPDQLHSYLASIRKDIAQFKAELDFLWKGDGEDFPGLQGEIAQAFSQFPANPESAIGRIPDYLETEIGT